MEAGESRTGLVGNRCHISWGNRGRETGDCPPFPRFPVSPVSPELDKVGDDLFSQVANEYITQLNREIQEVHGEMKQYGLVAD